MKFVLSMPGRFVRASQLIDHVWRLNFHISATGDARPFDVEAPREAYMHNS